MAKRPVVETGSKKLNFYFIYFVLDFFFKLDFYFYLKNFSINSKKIFFFEI